MKRIFLITLVLMASLSAFAEDGRRFYSHFEYGIEWGYTATFYEGFHYNYIDEQSQSRVDTRDDYWRYKSNGYITAFVGAKFAGHFSADILAGWSGVYEGRRVAPVLLRACYHINPYHSDGFKFFIDAGHCIAKSFNDIGIYMCRAGTGYRLILDNYFAVDYCLSVQMVSDHPVGVYDREQHVLVPDGNLLRSDCKYASINFSLALNF